MVVSRRYHRKNERGVTYLMLMFAIVLIGIATTAAAKDWQAIVQRELEADLLAKGIEIQNALALYSATIKAGRVMPGEVYPQTLADLTRLPKPFLRKVYLDPMGHGEWELLRAPTGGIMGVRSKSKHQPIKQANFPLVVRHFEGKPTHYDWVFQHPNPSMASVAWPITNPLIIPRRSPISEQPLVSDELDSPGSMDPQRDAVDSTDSPSI